MNRDTASKELAKKLDPSTVKERTQGGAKVSYIEGWHAIAEANRIFGHFDWHRETVDLRCVTEHERKIGRDQKNGWSVTYTARVRVTVDGVTRDGCGAGHGIGTDLGECHESALKEAETDAMKRALMTFGNPFGLALYDKSRENVGHNAPEASPAEVQTAKGNIAKCETLGVLAAWWKSMNQSAPHVAAHPEVIAAKDARKAELQQKEAA
jgi:DNA recombination protein Rad52